MSSERKANQDTFRQVGSGTSKSAQLRQDVKIRLTHQNLVNMASWTPKGDPPDTKQPSSIASGLPRPRMSLRDSRRASGFRATSTTLNSHDVVTGESSVNAPTNMHPSTYRHSMSGMSPPGGRPATSCTNYSRESSKENLAPPDAEEYEAQRRHIEQLKAELATVKYELDKQEKDGELSRLRTEGELRDATRRAEEDFKASQVAEADKARALRQVETLQQELTALRSDKDEQKSHLEANVQKALEEARALQEQLDDLSTLKDDAARQANREITNLKFDVDTLRRNVEEFEKQAEVQGRSLKTTQAIISERDQTIEALEGENLRLRASIGDVEAMPVVKRQLTEQVAHIRQLEASNREKLEELQRLRKAHKAVEIVEEEKRSLRRKLDAAEAVEAELTEERRQRQRLEDERLAWTAFLERESSTGAAEFDSPEALARALVRERLTSAALMAEKGEHDAELADRENFIQQLSEKVCGLENELEAAKMVAGAAAAAAAGGGCDEARKRVEHQRDLALQQVEQLRAQLKTFDLEFDTMQPELFDESRTRRIEELETLVNKYKAELQTLHSQLDSLESAATSPAAHVASTAGTKRLREDSGHDFDSEQLGQLARKNRTLQGEVARLQTDKQLLEKENVAKTEQLAAVQKQLRTRVLALQSNPTADHEAVKLADLRKLKTANDELVAQIQRQPMLYATVPASQLTVAQGDIEAAQAETASARKSAQRLKEVWAAKSHEFKEAVFSTLGWTVTFLPGGKMRVESVYYPSNTDEHENSIVFDGEKGTMKVGGGPRSAFATRIGDNVKFWVRERGCVPCFLAALTLEFYDEHTKATGS